MTRIALVAGEASGDLLAAHLIEALKQCLPDAEFFGVGGPKMQQAGCAAWWPAEALAVHGYADALRHYRRISGLRRELLHRLLKEKPDIFIGIDAPDFNLWLEQRLREAGVPTVHYVSPSVWAWRGRRIKHIARAVHHLLVLFPFEPCCYEQTDLPVTYVGHPLADLIPLEVDRQAARVRLNLPIGGPIFALLPGSRQSELRYMAATFIRVASLLQERFPHAIFLVPLVSPETRKLFDAALQRLDARGVSFNLLFGHTRDALAACDTALVASGTATLEAALLKAPMVITYRMSPVSHFLMKRMHYQSWIGLPNILAGEFIVPEFLQDEATPEKLAQALENMVSDTEARRRLTDRFTEIHRQLRQGTAEKAARAILAMLGKKK